MTAQTECDAVGVDAVLGRVEELCRRGLIRQIEHFIASYALWLVRAVETGEISPDDATAAFSSLDVWMREEKGLSLSDTVQDLIDEGEYLHHFGDTSLPAVAPKPDLMRELAMRILLG